MNNKSILITGGTGSFGKKFIDTLNKKYKPKKIIVYSRDELKQFEMQQIWPHSEIMRYFIGDVPLHSNKFPLRSTTLSKLSKQMLLEVRMLLMPQLAKRSKKL